MFSKASFWAFFIALCVQNSQAQTACSYQDVRLSFDTLKELFLEHSAESSYNELVYNELDALQNDLSEIRMSPQERGALASLRKDIDVVREFIAPISGGYNAHLLDKDMKRLQNIFDSDFLIHKLDVICKKDEVEFVEVRIRNLIMCYFHCVTDVAENGLRVKFKAANGNTCSSGEYGAMKGEYVPVLNNVGEKYLRVKSAVITKRF